MSPEAFNKISRGRSKHMHTILYTHPVCVEHDTGEFHPECSDRLKVVLKALESEEFMFLDRREAPPATVEQLERAHAPAHVKAVLEAVPAAGHQYVDGDTVLSPNSGDAALRSAGSICAAIDDVMAAQTRTNAFCAVRPPGHHAEHKAAMGFCFFSNAAVGALHARAVHGLERVAVVDFDVHHGNGTEDILSRHAGLFYASSHQSPAYPGTGQDGEIGIHRNLCNVEMPPGSDSAFFRKAYEDKILPALRDHNPELIIISAGFDAHARDPLAHCRLRTDDYAWITEKLVDLADECCQGRVVSILEGGYDLDALAASTAAHVRVMLNH